MINRKTGILAALTGIKFVMQYLLIDGVYDLHRDEYLHLDQAKHLAWGYDSVPPFTSWISWIIAALGNSNFWVKFFPALFGALTIIVVWKTVEKLGGGLFAQVLSALGLLLSVLLRINILFQPNSFDILAWTSFYYCLVCLIQSGENKWLYAAAFSVALGFLNKYNILFLLIGTFPPLLLTRQRKLLANRHFYFALLLALLLVLPNLVWQWQNGLPVIHHMHELTGTQLVNIQRSDFLKGQLLFFVGSFFVLIAAWISFFLYQPFKKFQVICWSFLFTLAIFTSLKAKAYYAIGLYPVLHAFGATYIQQLTGSGWLRHLRLVALLLPVLLSVPFIRIGFPTAPPAELVKKEARYKKFGMLRWEDGKEHLLPQDFADMLGWSELAARVDSVYATIADKEHTLIYCDNYGQAGAINYYSKFALHAVSMNADYVDWFPPAGREIKNLVLVKELKDDDPLRTREIPLFEKVQLAGAIQNAYAREKGTRIYLLLGAKVPVMPYFTREIRAVKAERDFFH